MGVCSSSQLAVEAHAKPGKSRAKQVSAQPAPAQPAPAQPAPSQPAPARVFAPPEQLGLEVTGPSLGKGAFGEVVRAIRRVDGNPVGLKMISKITFRGEEERRLMLLEARLAQRASHPHHPNVVTTYEYAEDAATFYMVMELASGGELMERITRHSVFSEAVAARYFAQLAEGLAHIHKQGVVHRDLKPENFLMEDASEGATVKITDFGLSDEIAEPDAELSDPCGSAFYIAPEVFKRKYTRAADVFSLGVNLFLFLSGTVPFGARAESEEMIYHAIQREPLRFGEEWQQISAAARELVGGLLEKDPTKRYTLEQALAHPWVHGAPDKPLDKSLLSSLLSFNARNKFKKIALRLVASNMTAAAVAQLRTEFMKIDVDNTGTITHKEMKQALEGMGGMGSVDPDALTALIKNVDIDGDGVISYDEFLSAVLDRKMLDNQQAMWKAFCEYDKNGDGHITAEEVRKVLEKRGEGIMPGDVERYIAEYDLNKDGVIDYSEFVQMLLPKDVKVKQSLPSRGRVPAAACQPLAGGGGGGGGGRR